METLLRGRLKMHCYLLRMPILLDTGSTSNATRNTKSTDKKNHHLRVPFAFWVAYWTKSGKSMFKPLLMKPDPDLNELARHSNHEILSEFKESLNWLLE